MNNEFACEFMAFKGEDDYVQSTNILVEVTDVTKDGLVEIAFNAPIPGKPRMYIKLDLGDLVTRAIKQE
jgi:translation initiation factor IF-1